MRPYLRHPARRSHAHALGGDFRLLLAFGTNLGNRVQNLKLGLQFVQSVSQVMATSSWHATEPLCHPDYPFAHHQHYYLNFVVDVSTSFHPYAFYHQIIVPIENQLGHSRCSKWEPRCLDIDIIFAAQNNAIRFKNCTPFEWAQHEFQVPHVGYPERHFWHKMVEDELGFHPPHE